MKINSMQEAGKAADDGLVLMIQKGDSVADWPVENMTFENVQKYIKEGRVYTTPQTITLYEMNTAGNAKPCLWVSDKDHYDFPTGRTGTLTIDEDIREECCGGLVPGGPNGTTCPECPNLINRIPGGDDE